MNQISGLFVLLPLIACGPHPKGRVTIDALNVPRTIHIHSRTFSQGGAIPKANTSYGENITPELSWSGVPANAKTLVLLVEDPDATEGTFTHWLMYAIQPGLKFLKAGLPSNRGVIAEGVQGVNDTGGLGYFGPRPPDSKPHHYHFQLFALSHAVRPRPGLDRSKVFGAIHDYAIGGGDLVGIYTKG